MNSGASVLLVILREHGLQVLARLGERLPAAVYEAAEAGLRKLLTCRTPEGGYVRLRCGCCGEARTVFFTCKSRLCPSCGWLAARRLVESLHGRLIKGRYRHIVFCTPRELRELFFWRRDLLAVACHAAAAATLAAYRTRCRAHVLLPGIIATCHTFGSNLHFHVHVHLVVTEGGLQVGGKWQPVKFFPAQEYRRYWQYELLSRLKKQVGDDKHWQARIGKLFRRYPSGFIVNLQSSYPTAERALNYCCRYMARPPIGERRILAYDGKHVTFQYKEYKTHSVQQQRCTVYQFVRLLLQHALPRYARNIHYYGLYQSQRWRKWFQAVRQASRFPQNVGNGDSRPLSWRERLIQTFEVDPVVCSRCGSLMLVEEVHLPRGRRLPCRPPNAPRQLTLGFCP